jgi:hypothetical protein
MSKAPTGRLYRSIGAPEEPGTIVALPSQTNKSPLTSFRRLRKSEKQKADLIEKLATDPAAKVGLTTGLILAISIGFTAVSAVAETLIFQSIDNLTRLVFVASVLYSSSKASPADSWAGWTSAPFALATAILINVNLSGMDLGGKVITQPLGLLVGLSEHTWVLLATAATAWVIGRRHQIAYMRAKRRAAKTRN